jgi:CRISPR/Cas system CSM-associated protein Csm2 small subunit
MAKPISLIYNILHELIRHFHGDFQKSIELLMKFHTFMDAVGNYRDHKNPFLGRLLSYMIQCTVSSPNV